MEAGFSSHLANVPPFLIGVVVGFLMVISCMRHWFALNAAQQGRQLVGSLRRLGLQYLTAGILITFVAANYAGQGLPAAARTDLIKLALWGLPWGIVAGFKWTTRRSSSEQ